MINKRKTFFALLVLTFLLFACVGYVFFRLGYFEFVKVAIELIKYPKEERERYKREFDYTKNEYTIGGIYVGHSPIDASIVYLLTSNGFNAKILDDNTILRSFEICGKEVFASLINNEKVTPATTVIQGYRQWISRVKNGSYVRIILAGPDNGGTVGNVREFHQFDWWVFMPMNTKMMCQNI